MSNKITIQQYESLERFANACSDLNSTLSMLNHHVEVLKRTNDIDRLEKLNDSLTSFLSSVVDLYKSKLPHEKDEN